MSILSPDGLYPNVDFYSGVIYRAIGIPVQMFTVLFAMGRLPGWIAHWLEMRIQLDAHLPAAPGLRGAHRARIQATRPALSGLPVRQRAPHNLHS